MTELTSRLAALADVDVRPDAPLAPLTSYKIGGPAERLVTAHTRPALAAVLAAHAESGEPWVVLGHGSNVLVADRGVRGTVLLLGRDFLDAALHRDARGPGAHLLEAGGGCPLARVLRLVKAEELAGLAFLAGIPATVGGAVRMNAGTLQGEVKDALVAVELAMAGAAAAWHDPATLGLGYRRSALPAGAVVTAARFAVSDAASPEERERQVAVLEYRKATQPLQLPSCGSVFANPPGDSAGRLIDAAGLKGRALGGAQVSPQHANWIVNVGGATAADVLGLIALCQREVAERFGVALRREVQLMGDFAGTEEGAP